MFLFSIDMRRKKLNSSMCVYVAWIEIIKLNAYNSICIIVKSSIFVKIRIGEVFPQILLFCSNLRNKGRDDLGGRGVAYLNNNFHISSNFKKMLRNKVILYELNGYKSLIFFCLIPFFDLFLIVLEIFHWISEGLINRNNHKNLKSEGKQN